MKKVVLLLSGKLQSGKNQFGRFVEKEFQKKQYKVKQDLYAKGVKDGAREDFADLVKHLRKEYGVVTKKRNWYEDKTDLTRILLQIYGTNIFRHRVHTNWWVTEQKNRIVKNTKDNVFIITDVRFPNEIDNLDLPWQDYQVYDIRINREVKDTKRCREHESETALDDRNNWSYVVDNNGTLNDLRQSAKVLVNEIIKYNQ